MKLFNSVEGYREFRDNLKDMPFKVMTRAITHLETVEGGLSPGEIWTEVKFLLSELRSVDKEDREVLLCHFYGYYYRKFTETGSGVKAVNYTPDQVNRTVTCIFYSLMFLLEVTTPKVYANPNKKLIQAIFVELKIINHPVLKELQRVFREDRKHFNLCPGYKELAVDPLAERNEDWDSSLRQVFRYYALRMESYLVKRHVEPFNRLWERLASDVRISELMRKPAIIKGDAHKELNVTYNSKLLFNIYGILFHRGCFLPSIKGETPLSVLVSEHYDAESSLKVKARYEYFKPESVGVQPQFLGFSASDREYIYSIIDETFNQCR